MLRVQQLSFVLDKLTKRHENHRRREDTDIPCLIAGDLNSIGDKFIRLSPFHCTDKYRVLSLGVSEAKWLEDNFWRAGGTPYFDFFDKTNDVTFKNSMWAGKLDWILLKGLEGGERQIGTGNESDHQWVSTVVSLKP
jgi:hypothetical protein